LFQAYFRFEKILLKSYDREVLRIKGWVFNSDDGERGFISLETEYMQEIADREERFTIYRQADASDKNITLQAFAFKYNTCKFRTGKEQRENILVRMVSEADQSKNETCPFPKGWKTKSYNQSFGDALFPPIPIEVNARCHIDVYGKINKMKKWTKLYSQDVFIKIKK
jgi:hypothetical protein